MPTKTIEIFNGPGLVADLPLQHLSGNAVSSSKNMRFNEWGAEACASDRRLFTPPKVTPVVWTAAFPPIENPVWVYATLEYLYTVQGSTHISIVRSTGEGAYYSGVASERWNSCALAGYAIFNNTIDLPQSWAGFNPAVRCSNLANWDITRRAKVIRSFKNFLVALNLTDSGVRRPYRILWSSPAKPGLLPPSWDSSDPAQAANEIDLSETSDKLVDCLRLSDINVVYKESSTWGMSYIGPPYYFNFWEILANRGLLHRDCCANYPGGHVVATQDDIIKHNGQKGSDESVIDKRLRKWIFSALDQNFYYNSFMFSYPARTEVWFCFPESGATYATIAVIWNWTTNSLSVRDLDSIPFINMGPVGISVTEDLAWDPEA